MTVNTKASTRYGVAPTQDLKGHRALITGASSGLGESFARQLAARGADLVIAARRKERLEALASELSKQFGVRVDVVQVDLSVTGTAQELVRQSIAAAPVTILVNNAGVGPYAPFMSEKREKHVNTVQLNVMALTELSHLLAAHMNSHKKPSFIVNVGSIASFQSAPNFAVYSATKHFVRVFSEVLRAELSNTNISVTCLCPGGTLTEFMEVSGQILKKGASSVMMTADEVVRIGLIGMLSKQRVVVPGLINKIACLLPRLIPASLALWLAGFAMDRNVSRVGHQPGESSVGESSK